jgi:hypothetical protein
MTFVPEIPEPARGADSYLPEHIVTIRADAKVAAGHGWPFSVRRFAGLGKSGQRIAGMSRLIFLEKIRARWPMNPLAEGCGLVLSD